jgi:hypothetical protein
MAGFRVFRRRFSPAASLIEKGTDERRTSNIERPTSNNEFCRLKKTEQHAAQAPALHERICSSKFPGSLVIK